MNPFLGFNLIIICIMLLFMCRVDRVAKERMRMNRYCSRKAHEAIDNGKVDENTSVESYWEPYERHSFDEMVFKFWIPVSRFYKDFQ